MSTLHKAALVGDLPELKRLVAEGVDIDFRDEGDGRTPLMAACLSPHTSLDVVEFLLDHGADVNAVSHAKFEEDKPLIALAVSNPPASCEKIRLLIEHGAYINYRSSHGYTLLIWAAYSGREDVIDLLLAVGAPVDGESTHRESALSVLSHTGRFRSISKVLARGADPAPLQWTPLMRAIALGTVREVEGLLNGASDPETVDFWERTPFLLSLHTGDTEKAALLLERGANRNVTGRCGKPPMHYPIDRDDTEMLQWLIEQGFDRDQEDQFGNTALIKALETNALGCFQALLMAGADWTRNDKYGDGLIRLASHPEIIRILIDLGADAADLEADARRTLIGLGTVPDLPVSEREYLDGRFRRFGNANPERMNVPFWNAMVRCGWSGFQAAQQFGDDSYGRNNPVWSHDRFGMSLTKLPDGRFIQIAGEHEDHYDPDFCIYNDVIIHNGRGNLEILGYPEDIFPPTDFHSATLVGPWIYVIGNLGYPQMRDGSGRVTPVYRFHIESGWIERVATSGTAPGWIHRHRADYQDGGIRISGGKTFVAEEDWGGELRNNDSDYYLDLETSVWTRL
jgi:ankyrin repeat protein